ncbi:MAG: hypothetical protein IPJ74_26285 [Saprospiraceae bacterium]|nr:hypothetical protein [Saprospiraceae bacterium]
MKQIEEVFQLEIRGQQIPARVIRNGDAAYVLRLRKDAVILRMPILTPLEAQQNISLGSKTGWEKGQKYPDILLRLKQEFIKMAMF